MSRIDDLSSELFEHCFGRFTPLEDLLQRGRFPEGWVTRYSELIEEARPHIRADATLPYKLFVSLHWASIYPWIRYLAWRADNAEDNETLQGLRTVAGRSELLLMRAAHEGLARHGADLAHETPLRGFDVGMLRALGKKPD